ncbi:MAG: hypothetical protein Q7U16_12610 [Agitococcus sp.]|nr:hypothetical protein [Agitococcus sp.]
MPKLSVQTALKQVLAEMKEMSPEQLRKELTSARTGQLSCALNDAQRFLASIAVPPREDSADELVIQLRMEALTALRRAEHAAHAWFSACQGEGVIGWDIEKSTICLKAYDELSKATKPLRPKKDNHDTTI